MKKAKYIIVNSKDEYFVEINKLNEIVFTKDKDKATQVEFSDTEDLIPLIELYSGKTSIIEEV